MTTDNALRWWAILGLHLVAAIALATGTILLLHVVADAAAASAAAEAAVPALIGTT
jgi:hypothetical protein